MSVEKMILEDIALADRIKSQAPESAVSADAIFHCVRSLPKTRKRKVKTTWPSVPPDEFHEAVKRLRGQALTVGEFIFRAGFGPAGKSQRDAIGRWLRASGRKPRSCGGRRVFDL